jgi:MarR family transcriptional regulator, organic hydroperoxide resistance regulator
MKARTATSGALDVMQSLWALSHALEARSKWMLRNLGVTGPQRLLLRFVGEAPGCSPGEAARGLRLNPGTVSRLATGLERSGLVRRAEDRSDGRRQRLILTRRGESLNRDARWTVEAAVRASLDGATAAEVRQARAFVDRLVGELALPRGRLAPRRGPVARRRGTP